MKKGGGGEVQLPPTMYAPLIEDLGGQLFPCPSILKFSFYFKITWNKVSTINSTQKSVCHRGLKTIRMRRNIKIMPTLLIGEIRT